MQHKQCNTNNATQTIRRLISLLLLAVMVFNGISLTSHKAYAVSAQSINDAASKFAAAVGSFAAKDASANVGKITNFCSRLGGLTSAVSGVVGILQMIGIVKDSTSQMLGQILDAVKDVQTELGNMNRTLNQIAQSLINIQVAQEEKDRNNKATTMSTNWNNFNTNYTEKLQTYLEDYEAKINAGIKAWWEQTSHEGVYVLMTKKYTDEDSLTYSKSAYSAGLPSKSDINNETVNTAWSIGIPSECMPNTRSVNFNVDTYRDDFKKLMITALGNAIKDNKLASNCGASVKSEYNGSSRQKMLESYADNVLNTVIYKISCQVMTANNSWVANVISTYGNYCKNILQQNSGVNAFLNYIYLTHAFEGEVKSDIETFLDGMTAQAGFYGEFALTCAGQSSLQTTTTKEQIREYFTNTVLSIADRKTKAITGYDNYCYITGTRLEADTVTLRSSMYIGRSDNHTYTGCDAKSWSVTVPPIADSVYLPIIYRQYTKLPQGTKSFGAYLNKYGVQKDANNKTYMTQYSGVQTFAFSEGIRMTPWYLIDNGQRFKHRSYREANTNWYDIDVGGFDTEQEYYHVHDKVVGDLFNSSNGSQSLNAILAARAFYGESHWYWKIDVAYGFYTKGVNFSVGDGYEYDKWAYFSRTVDILKSSAYHDLNGDGIDDPDNPFGAFKQVSLVEGVSELMEPIYQSRSKDIDEVLLDSESYPYNGRPVEPEVTVFSSGDIVSEDNYVVTYLNNEEPGDAMVKVEGIGDYSGVVTKNFTITGDSSTDTDTDSESTGYLGSPSGSCNSINSLGLLSALGLVFLTKKLKARK